MTILDRNTDLQRFLNLLKIKTAYMWFVSLCSRQLPQKIQEWVNKQAGESKVGVAQWQLLDILRSSLSYSHHGGQVDAEIIGQSVWI